MPVYVRTFVVENVVRIHRHYSRSFALVEAIIAEERRAGLPPSLGTLRLLEASYLKFNRQLDAVAKRTATQADAAIKERIQATRALNRGDTGRGQHLRNSVRSRALPRIGGLAHGAVGVADVRLLDALRNPVGHWGPYWQAQEYGTAAPSARGAIPAQKGRVIRGAFFGRGFAGSGEPPRREFQGLRVGPHPIFVSSRAGAALFQAAGFTGARGVGRRGGVAGGFGTISVELPGRHFIRDGANAARVNWRSAMRALEFQALRDLRAVGVRP